MNGTAKHRLEKRWMPVLFMAIAVSCWGSLLSLKGIWWDDWAWVWHYLSSGSVFEFVSPFASLRHMLDGFILFLNFKMLDISPLYATKIWNIFKFAIYLANAGLLWAIIKKVTQKNSPLPAMIAIAYLVSPLVNNLCLVELVRRIYLFSFLLSILFSIRSVEGEFDQLYYYGALLCASFSMAGLESFVFFEASRVAIVYILLSRKRSFSKLEAIKKSLTYWAPFILIGIIILLYNTGVIYPRTGVYAGAYQLYRLSALDYFVRIFFDAARSIFYLFTGSLYGLTRGARLLTPDTGILGASLVSAVASTFILLELFNIKDQKSRNEKNPFKEAGTTMVFGIFLLAIGIFPYVIVRGPIVLGLESRHALLGSLAISVIVPSALLSLMSKKYISRVFLYIFFGVYIFFNVFQCNMAVKSYSNDWQQQVSFWEKFTAAVPDLKYGTYLVIDMPREESEYFGPWRGSYEFAAPLNILYAKARTKDELNKCFAESLRNAMNPTIEWSYAANRGKSGGRYISFKGIQNFYTDKIVLSSYRGGNIYVHDARAGVTVKEERPGEYPLRWIIK